MKYYYDLHIHSTLSACADVLMTPNNILNMASLKGLDIIAVTDHNSTKQLAIIHEIAKSYDFLIIPGVEISVYEGYHVLCYFKHLKDALAFDDYLDENANHTLYNTEKYGEQIITNIYDEAVETVDYLLSNPLKRTLLEVMEALKPYEHLLFYAHVDRNRQSGLKDVHQIKLHGIEISKQADDDFIERHQLSHMKCLYNSDSHELVDLFEKGEKNQIELKNLTIDAFFEAFHHG
jgi:PHP family Zn ribbon phosphoesterase